MFERLKRGFRNLVDTARTIFTSEPTIANEHPIANDLPRRQRAKPVKLQNDEVISKREVREFRKLEKRWNKEHERYWRQFRNQPLYSGGKPEDVTVTQHQAQTRTFRKLFQQPMYRRNANLSKVKNRAEFEKLKQTMRYEMSEDYRIDRVNTFSDNIMRNIQFYGDRELVDLFESLTFEELQQLQETTLFTSDFFELIPSDPNKLTKHQKDEIAERVSRMKAEMRRVHR